MRNSEKIYGLIGYPLAHSFSQKYFSKKFLEENIYNTTYELFPLKDISELPQLIQGKPQLLGLNVTIPHKITVIPFLNELHPSAEEVGAVNTIHIRERKLKGFNTDIYGFRRSLKPLLKPWHKKALILGTGGASKAVSYALGQLGIENICVSREPAAGQLSYNALSRDILSERKLIINTTPLGMAPHIDSVPDLPFQYLDREDLLFDLVYNPEKTVFLRKGEEQGSQIKNGLEMLYLQAEESWRIWNEDQIK